MKRQFIEKTNKNRLNHDLVISDLCLNEGVGYPSINKLISAKSENKISKMVLTIIFDVSQVSGRVSGT